MMNGIRVSLVISLLPLLHYRANVASHRVPGEQFGGCCSSESVGNVLQPWVRRRPGSIWSLCVQEEAIVLKIATLLCHRMLHASHWVAEFSLSTFSKCDSKISVFYLHNLERLLSNMSILPSPPHCPHGCSSRNTEANFQRCRDGTKRPIPRRGWKSGRCSLLRPPAWLAVQPWASHLASLDVTKSIFKEGRF